MCVCVCILSLLHASRNHLIVYLKKSVLTSSLHDWFCVCYILQVMNDSEEHSPGGQHIEGPEVPHEVHVSSLFDRLQ